jgi:ATP-dependent DNA helicase RecQ
MDGLDERLRDRFGLPALHPWQREAIEEVLEGSGRVLVVAPTGGGKSLCYQLPATELRGTSVVVCPLIALMEDQVRALQQRGIEATFLASTLDREERARREEALTRGAYRIVYVAPEALAGGRTMQLLTGLRPPLVAIDEAHCISQWGHDFRPDYLRLGDVVARLAPPRVVACTATATPQVRQEILTRLRLDEASTRVVLRGFARPNLHLEARHVEVSAQRRKTALAAVRDGLGNPTSPTGAAIVYAGTRRGSEQMAAELAKAGWRAAAYHAGLPPDERAEVNRRFADGALSIVAATNAFGMGIDRADIRVVVHSQAPGSIEGYYQEVGRAGRDGQAALGLLLTSSADFGLRRRLIDMDRETAVSEAHRERQWQMFLDLMRYVEAGSCRHDFILRYFGDEQETLGGCGHCDVCARLEAGGTEGAQAAVSAEAILVIRKALSGVARVRGGAGLRAVADMLHGADSAKQRKLGLHRMTTHGLLHEHSVDWILALLRRLLTAGLLDVTGDRYPVPFLTPAGVAVMKGEATPRVLLPDDTPPPRRERSAPAAPKRTDHPPEVVGSPLFQALREARSRLAREHGLPAYVICHDRTLAQIAADRPTTRTALQSVHGMGPARIDRWGEPLLAVVRDHP